MALILDRKVNETIMIGDDISITVTRIEGTKCRLAINAPDEVIIERDECREPDHE